MEKHSENRKENTQQWREKNLERTKLMNEFYRSTKSLSEEQRSILVQEFKQKHNINDHVSGQPSKHRKEHYEKEGVTGKDCSVAGCGWKALTHFNNNSNSWDRLRTTCKDCMKKHRVASKDVRNKYYKKRMTEDVQFRLRQNIKNRIHNSLRFYATEKDDRIIHYLGCPMHHFKDHMESLFTEGMSWNKYGHYEDENGNRKIGIQIDHIIPCNAFDLNNPQELLLCFHWKNCQPMWGEENMSKSDTYKQEDKLRYIESMKEIMDNTSLDQLIENVQKDIKEEMEREKEQAELALQKEVENKALQKKQSSLFEDYLYDQCLENMQVMFFMYENANSNKGKEYKKSPLFLMKNKESRKTGGENAKSKTVYQYTITDRKFIRSFDCMSEAAKECGISHASLSNCCRQKTQSSAGFWWSYDPPAVASTTTEA